MDFEKRDCFTFFGSFYDAMRVLSDKERLALYDAIVEYGLYSVVPVLDGVPAALFSLMRPNIDGSNRKRAAGRAGGLVGAGGAPVQNQNARKNTLQKTIAKQKQNKSDIEIEKEIEEEKEIDIEREGIERGEAKELTSPADHGSSPQNGADRGKKMTDADFERLRQERIYQLLNFERSKKNETLLH